MKSQRPNWLPDECVHYDIKQLKPELTYHAQPFVLFVGEYKQPGSGLADTRGGTCRELALEIPTEGIGAIWGCCPRSDGERHLEFLRTARGGTTTFLRMYDGLAQITAENDCNGVLRTTEQDTSMEVYLKRIDAYLVRPECIIQGRG